MKRPNLLKTCLIIPICLLSLAQCGLEYLPYLTPPERLEPLNYFKVRKTAANDSEFVVGEWEYKGIELYYKFYLPGTMPDSDRDLTELNDLTAKGYRRISSPNDIQTSVKKPVMDIAGVWLGDVGFSFRIDLADKKIEEIVTTTEVVSDLRRGVPYPAGEPGAPYFRRFLWNDSAAVPPPGFKVTDADMDSGLYDFMTSYSLNIIMAMYALSYGKIDDLYDLHSDAVYLGEININFGW